MDTYTLHKLQAMPLDSKVLHSIAVMQSYYERMNHNVYVSFSGGADSTVVLHIARKFVDKNIPAVFCNTGQEWPQIVKFVRSFDNVTIIRPKYTFEEILRTKGFPLVSKEVSYYIRQIQTLRPDTKTYKERLGNGKFSLPKKWRPLIDKGYKISEKCCYFLKKEPFHAYEKASGRSPYIGIMAAESRTRELRYIKMGGCNSFSDRRNVSWPIAIWNEKDVWEYIFHNNIPYCNVYSELEDKRTGCMCCGYGVIGCPTKLFTLYKKYPRLYKRMLSIANNGITYKAALKDTGIILPDE